MSSFTAIKSRCEENNHKISRAYYSILWSEQRNRKKRRARRRRRRSEYDAFIGKFSQRRAKRSSAVNAVACYIAGGDLNIHCRSNGDGLYLHLSIHRHFVLSLIHSISLLSTHIFPNCFFFHPFILLLTTYLCVALCDKYFSSIFEKR